MDEPTRNKETPKNQEVILHEDNSTKLLRYLKYLYISFGITALVPMIFMIAEASGKFVLARLLLLLFLSLGYAALEIITAIYLPKMKNWAWWIAFVTGIINIILLFPFGILISILPLLGVIYLLKKEIREVCIQ